MGPSAAPTPQHSTSRVQWWGYQSRDICPRCLGIPLCTREYSSVSVFRGASATWASKSAGLPQIRPQLRDLPVNGFVVDHHHPRPTLSFPAPPPDSTLGEEAPIPVSSVPASRGRPRSSPRPSDAWHLGLSGPWRQHVRLPDGPDGARWEAGPSVESAKPAAVGVA